MKYDYSRKYILSISFCDYRVNTGGVPKVIAEHQKMFLDAGIGYIYLFPIKKLICHDQVMIFCFWGMIIDGKFAGVFSIRQVLKNIYCWQQNGATLLEVHLHHLIYMNLKHVKKLLEYINNVQIRFFVHDYYTICIGYNLLKNGKEYCGSEGINQQKCFDCKYYKRSLKIEPRIRNLLLESSKRLIVIAPSQVAKDIWCNSYPELTSKAIVIPHQVLEGKYNKRNINHNKIRVAFIGNPATLKGSDTWQKLVELNSEDSYEFYEFHNGKPLSTKVNHIPVCVRSENLNSMIEALRDNEIDVVLLWSIWQETYSYTYFESYAAHAYVITNPISGNICNMVQKNLNGCICHNEQELFKLFKNKDYLRLMISEFNNGDILGPERVIPNNMILRLVLENHHSDTSFPRP